MSDTHISTCYVWMSDTYISTSYVWMFDTDVSTCYVWMSYTHFSTCYEYDQETPALIKMRCFNHSVQFRLSVMSSSLWHHGLQHARPPCPSPTPRVYPNSYLLSRWCHPTNLLLCHPLLLPPSTFPSIRLLSNEFAQPLAIWGSPICTVINTPTICVTFSSVKCLKHPFSVYLW